MCPHVRIAFLKSTSCDNRVYSNSCCSCSFEPENIKIGQSSHKMYSNKILNFQESTTIVNACTKKSGNLLNAPSNLKAAQMNMQCSLIQEFMLYKFEMGCSVTEATKNICCAKGEGAQQ